jgi:hypothetical protein
MTMEVESTESVEAASRDIRKDNLCLGATTAPYRNNVKYGTVSGWYFW